MIDDLRIRNYSQSTIDSYVYHVARFASYFGKSPDKLGAEEVRRYQLHMVDERKLSWSMFNQASCALRFFYFVTLGADIGLKTVPYAKARKHLPVVLNHRELARLFEATSSLKHRTILKAMYAAGLRVGEAVALEVSDLDSERMRIFVRQGKGNKDRYTILTPSLLETLRVYWRAYRPTKALFPNRSLSRPLQTSCVQDAVREARAVAGITKPVTCHTLRHTFATHLLEAGVDLHTIRELLGHRSLDTTSLYLHVATSAPQTTKEATDLLSKATLYSP
jgi:site-specific recombinase XerD